MPFIRIAMFPRDQDVKDALAKEITDAVCRHCKVTPEATWILFEDVRRENWSMGGKFQVSPPAKS